MDYRVITTAPGTTIETIRCLPHNVLWNHANATNWAHTVGNGLPAGTRIQIDRRQGGAMYQSHRRYTVSDSGITRRTDR